MRLLGLDLSQNSPGFTVLYIDEDFKIADCFFYCIQETIKWKRTEPRLNVTRFEKYKGSKTHDHTLEILALVRKLVTEHKIDYAVVEGYSFSSEDTSSLTQLAEVAGAVKLGLYNISIPYLILPPRALKKFITSNGSAEKEQMIDNFNRSEHKKWFGDLNYKELPYLDDLIDSFWLAYTLHMYLFYFKRNNYILLIDRQKLEWSSSKDSKSIVQTKMIQKP